jgi:transcriptional regulator with XRE-family HTH domain
VLAKPIIMTQNEIIGNNIRHFREKLEITQEGLGNYLKISREEVSYYETGKRNIPTEVISKAAKLFGLEEYDLFEVDAEVNETRLAFAFRANTVNSENLVHVANFRKIVLNYLNMKKALSNESTNLRKEGK